ncbi:hypothetical protein OM076_00640 [Solirubrobacter ginsenosidimutans]|uniref:Uncharacterized protein n=1 Tax=Solirubrobacter ginsenosidimutans TaxID=490573 RepID=A0A9X3MM43_9ACTN|nr:hypothetical protein [Solirubrobacter ginsenosidimutans]MDA0158754.1 hypothetical protein [Solirubrobacter ginsenosidimutans]
MAPELKRVQVRAIAYDAEPIARRLRVDYITRPAHRFESVAVQETPDEVRIAIFATAPRGPTRASGHMHSLMIVLAQPVGTRRVVDTRSERVLQRLPAPVDPPQPGGPGT